MKNVFITLLFVFVCSTPSFAAERYILNIELSQSRLSLNVWEHLKDAMNAVTFQLPVDKQFYDDVKPGQNLVNEFRSGSFIMKGSFSNWNMVVKSKQIIKE